MRAIKQANPLLMDYFRREIEPQLPQTLWGFDEKLQALGLPKRKYFLFGSFSEGVPTKRSDVDIGVVFETPLDGLGTFYDLLEERGTLTRIKGARIELTMYRQEDMDVMKHDNPKIREVIIEPPHQDPERLA